MASNIEFLLVPLLFARDNIGFLHHVLELSYYFLSPDDSAQNVYNLLVFLLHYHESIISPFEKKVFLFKFFLEIGMYPEHGMQNIQQLQRMTLREMLDTLNKFDEKVLEQWLIACIGAHPLRKYFKTLPIGIEQCLV